jgi:predicted transcriptional regulator
VSEQISAEFIMEDDLFAINKDGTIEDALFAMFVNRFRRLLVEEDGDIIGILTSSDILAAVQKSSDRSFLRIPISEYMTDKLVHVNRSESVLNVCKKMQDLMISGILVSDDKDNFVGIITEKDVTYFDVLWQNIEGLEIDTEWKTEPTVEINENYSWWQAIDKFSEIDRRELLVKNDANDQYLGIITKMDILKAINLHSDEIREDELFIQLSPIETLYNKHFIYLNSPVTIRKCRKLMNIRAVSSIPIFQKGVLKKIVNESTMVQSYIMYSEMD